MPLIAKFYEKEFNIVNTIRFRNDNEEDIDVAVDMLFNKLVEAKIITC